MRFWEFRIRIEPIYWYFWVYVGDIMAYNIDEFEWIWDFEMSCFCYGWAMSHGCCCYCEILECWKKPAFNISSIIASGQMVSRASALESFSIICCISAGCLDVPRGMEALEAMEISLAFWDGKSGFEAINSSKLKKHFKQKLCCVNVSTKMNVSTNSLAIISP